MRYPTRGIRVNAGIFVKIATPKKIPDRIISRVFLGELLIALEGLLTEIANHMEHRRKGSKILSKYTIRSNQIIGITANKKEDRSATLLL